MTSKRTLYAKERVEKWKAELREAKRAERERKRLARIEEETWAVLEPVRAGLTDARKRLGLSQQDVGDMIGRTRPSLANFETGRQRLPLDVLWRYAEAVGVQLHTLIPRNGDTGEGE